MKKTLIALAAAAVTGAYAQSTVQLTGNLDLGVNSIDNKGAQVTTMGAANGSSTSVIVMKGTEDLGGGMKASFQWEASIDLGNAVGRTSGTSSTGSTSNVTSYLGNGNSFLALEGGFGTIKLGTPNLSTLTAHGNNSGFSTAVGSGYRVASFDAVRLQNAIRYESPSMGGISFTLHGVTRNNLQSNANNTASGNNVNQIMGRDGALEFSLQYASPKFSAQLVHIDVTQDASSNPTLLSATQFSAITGAKNFTAAGGKFSLDTIGATLQATPSAKIGVFWQRTSSSDLLAATSSGTGAAVKYDRTAYGLSGALDVSPKTTVMANFMTLSSGGQETVGNANATTTVMGLGVNYALSKRTNAYLRYEADVDGVNARSTTGYTAGTGNSTYTATAIGLKHTF